MIQQDNCFTRCSNTQINTETYVVQKFLLHCQTTRLIAYRIFEINYPLAVFYIDSPIILIYERPLASDLQSHYVCYSVDFPIYI